MRIDLKNPNHQRALLCFLGVGFLAYLWFGAPFVPGNFQARAKRLGQLRTRYEHLSSDLTKARQAVASLDRLEAESRRLHDRWAVVREELPDRRELASLLRRITLSGSQSGVHFVLFQPGPPQMTQYYTDNPVKISVVGGYHQVATFLSEIAGLSRLVNTHELTLTQVANKDGQDVTTEAQFTASAYTLGGSAPVSASMARNANAKGAAQNGQSLAKLAP